MGKRKGEGADLGGFNVEANVEAPARAVRTSDLAAMVEEEL